MPNSPPFVPTLEEVHAWAIEYDRQLLAGDERFTRSILVIHEEGSVFSIMNAFLVEVADSFVVMFSEHQGLQVWHKEDLAGAAQFANRGAPDPVQLVEVGKEPPPRNRTPKKNQKPKLKDKKK